MTFATDWKKGGRMRFEDKKFCQIRTLAERWDCSTRRIYDLISKQVIKPWHPEKLVGRKGMMVDVQSVLNAESSGYLDNK